MQLADLENVCDNPIDLHKSFTGRVTFSKIRLPKLCLTLDFHGAKHCLPTNRSEPPCSACAHSFQDSGARHIDRKTFSTCTAVLVYTRESEAGRSFLSPPLEHGLFKSGHSSECKCSLTFLTSPYP